jgi:Ternary complex associated domain 9
MDPHKPGQVIVADNDAKRSEQVCAALLRHFVVKVETVRAFQDLEGLARVPREESVDLVIVADTLTRQRRFPELMREFLRDELFWDPALSLPVHNLLALVSNLTAKFDNLGQHADRVLSTGLGPDCAELVKIIKDHEWLPSRGELPPLSFPGPPLSSPGPANADPILEEQIRSLDPSRDLRRARETLQELIRELWECAQADVRRLTQGFSGDLVLRVDPIPPPRGNQSFVLKIAQGDNNCRRLRGEIAKRDDIESAFDVQGLMRFVPLLWRPPSRHPLVGRGELLCAVAFQLLGGEEVGEFINLGRAYRHHAPSLARRVIDGVVESLKRAWYNEAELTPRVLWSPNGLLESGDAADPTSPLYGFSVERRARLLASLEFLEEFADLLPEWTTASRQVKDWVCSGPGDHGALAGVRPTLLSRTHGDLNSANILWWLEQDQSFLIDFAMYREDGHALHDLARLEAEVKFALMDRDDASHDYMPKRLAAWRTLERQLASTNWQSIQSPKGQDGVQRAAGLSQHIRDQANRIYQDAFPPGAGSGHFLFEYFTTLLYHTLRAISYEQLSPFKRLLAVFSAAQLIGQLRQLP